ncbi:hypothetical protein [Mangrovicoccus algicola]|uniref:Uncharacterized protein n=1 Tax=Mangrovicoccus algicola TaxID=2771008 RepID=A0A8J7D0M3_9RHOB|nr:hypothetical protein [Mangrovicoccus algicola]MBE3639643.1 hypothetical protein [Mangrovicoccus algicola]
MAARPGRDFRRTVGEIRAPDHVREAAKMPPGGIRGLARHVPADAAPARFAGDMEATGRSIP